LSLTNQQFLVRNFHFGNEKKKKEISTIIFQKQALNVVVMTEETEEKDMSSKSKQQKGICKKCINSLCPNQVNGFSSKALSPSSL
jgi:hypothetical protein